MKRFLAESIRRHNVAVLRGAGHNTRWPQKTIRESGRMYAICFDLDTEQLNRHHGGPHPNYGYEEIRRILAKHGFNWQQGSVYFGDANVTPVTCVVAVQAVQKECPWFAKVVNDIRMLRIEENNDLMPAIGELDLFDGQLPIVAAE
jgi:virulence-associated protein VapD